MKYEIGVTVILPDGVEHDLAFLDLSLEQIKNIIEINYPTFTSFMLICIPMEEDC